MITRLILQLSWFFQPWTQPRFPRTGFPCFSMRVNTSCLTLWQLHQERIQIARRADDDDAAFRASHSPGRHPKRAARSPCEHAAGCWIDAARVPHGLLSTRWWRRRSLGLQRRTWNVSDVHPFCCARFIHGPFLFIVRVALKCDIQQQIRFTINVATLAFFGKCLCSGARRSGKCVFTHPEVFFLLLFFCTHARFQRSMNVFFPKVLLMDIFSERDLLICPR